MNFRTPSPGQPASESWFIDRRDFLKAAAGSLFGLVAGGCVSGSPGRETTRRFGLITDPHYADADPKGTRFYRESLGKVREAIDRLRSEKLAFLGILGDTKDMAADEPDTRTLSHLVAIEREIQRFDGPTYHVLGNHDMDNLSKAQVLSHIKNTGIAGERSYYAFSRGGIRFVTLDANYMTDGRDYDHGNFDWKDTNIPPAELKWLTTELAAATEPVIVLAHQRLDGTGAAFVKNAADVRRALETSGKVLGVFQGHDHPGAHSVLNGIHYYTLRAIIEGSGEANNSYAVVEVGPNLDLTVTGYRRAVSLKMEHRVPAAAT
jgi:hypothetical protein